ncbi:tetratricopeptide repeat protein [Streptomyces cinerochromogenes]|uniref:Tetratricopeptide repeat protein n=1 Tax=Streptomyces cinerochromogenes TaxID=66422 RepID=A0ABW7BKF0_9ACTN
MGTASSHEPDHELPWRFTHSVYDGFDTQWTATVIRMPRKAVVPQGKAGNRRGEGAALTKLGRSLEELGRYEEAAGVYQRDIDICRVVGDWHGEAGTQNNLGLFQGIGAGQ